MAFESEHLEQPQMLNNELSKDRISSLNDDLLINILDFLPTKSAFVTSTLSRRWSHLFKEVNTIDFDDPLVFNDRNAFDDSIVEDKSLIAFRAFVRRMNGIKLSNLKRFRIISAEHNIHCFIRKVESWLSTVLSHGIREIDLSFDTDIKVPNTIFTCKTLCIIKLSAYAIVYLPETVSLPCLKILHLKKVMVLGLTSLGKFLSGCPLLYDLCLESFCNEAGQLSFSSPSLTRLSLKNNMRFSNYHARPLVAFVAPLLQYFHYADHLANSYSITTSSSLIEAYLDIPRFESFEDVSAISCSAHDLIQGVSSVKRLFLSAQIMEALTYVKDELPILSRLTKLELGSSTILHVTLPRLLESAPYLEELIFTKGLFPAKFKEKDVVEQDYWGRHEDVPSCLKTELKVVQIKHLLGFTEELRMVEYFLSNGRSLARLTIHKWAGIGEQSQVTKQLQTMAKRWNKCVHFSDLLL